MFSSSPSCHQAVLSLVCSEFPILSLSVAFSPSPSHSLCHVMSSYLFSSAVKLSAILDDYYGCTYLVSNFTLHQQVFGPLPSPSCHQSCQTLDSPLVAALSLSPSRHRSVYLSNSVVRLLGSSLSNSCQIMLEPVIQQTIY